MDDRARILALVRRTGRASAGEVAAKLGVSRQAAHRKLRALATAGELALVGAGRGAAWEPAATARREFRYRAAALAEDRVFAELEADVPALVALDRDTRSVVAYTMLEMLNNAIEHAAAKSIRVVVEPRATGLAFEIVDDGVGAFAHLRARLGLGSLTEAIAEVQKGKVTTDPARHTGEGLFFTSKVADRFELDANGLCWVVDARRGDTAVQTSQRRSGTRVRVEVSQPPRMKLADVFSSWTTDASFDRTRIVVKLFEIGTDFLSRSEARRLLRGLERFHDVILDFRGVSGVGQAFADEVFRVWATAHPATVLRPIAMNEAVAFMVKRAARPVEPG